MDRDKLRLAGYAVAAILAIVVGVRLLGGGDGGAAGGVTVEPAGHTGSGVADAYPRARGGGAPGSVLVQVAGEVNRPGVYRVASGGRVQDAVEKAGGLTSRSDQTGINLVARVQDGQQIIVIPEPR